MRSAFANCPATPYAQMSAEATGTSGETRSARMSSTSAHAALAPTLPPLAPARISAEYVCEVGVTPRTRISRYTANASRHRSSSAAPSAWMYAVYVNAVGATRDRSPPEISETARIQEKTARALARSPRRPATERTVVATCALGGAGAEAVTPGSSSPESSAPSGFKPAGQATSTSSSSSRETSPSSRETRSSSHAMGAPLASHRSWKMSKTRRQFGPAPRYWSASLSSRERKPRYEVADGALAASEMVTSPRTARADTSRSRGVARRARRGAAASRAGDARVAGAATHAACADPGPPRRDLAIFT